MQRSRQLNQRRPADSAMLSTKPLLIYSKRECSSRTSSKTKPQWVLSYIWDYCPAGNSSDTQASASTHEEVPPQFLLGFLIFETIFPSTHCRFPVPEEANQLQSVTEPCPCLTAGRVFFSVYSSSSRNTAEPLVLKVPV